MSRVETTILSMEGVPEGTKLQVRRSGERPTDVELDSTLDISVDSLVDTLDILVLGDGCGKAEFSVEEIKSGEEEVMWLDLDGCDGAVQVKLKLVGDLLKGTTKEVDDDDALEKELKIPEEPEEEAAEGSLFQMEDVDDTNFTAIKPFLGSLFAPSDYKPRPDPYAAPTEDLDLEYVHGYRCDDARDNVFWVNDDAIVYHTAGVGVVHDIRSHQQTFFLGHTDDIVSLAYHPGKKLVATGQMGKKPKICVWEAETCKPVCEFSGFHDRAVSSLSFSGDGHYLASIGEDDRHSLAIYDLSKKKLAASSAGDKGRVLNVTFNPEKSSEILSFGVKHVKIWDADLRSGMLQGKRGVFGTGGVIPSVLCACLFEGHMITGCSDGMIREWRGNRVGKEHKSQKGPVISMASSPDGSMLAAGGRDKMLHLYGTGMRKQGSIQFDAEIRAIAFDDTGRRLVVGTKDGCVWIVDAADGATPKAVVDSHYGEVWGLCRTLDFDFFCTAADDGTFRRWSLPDKKCVRKVKLGESLRTCDVSPDGSLFAVGTSDGTVMLLDGESWEVVSKQMRRRREISIVRFSPDGLMLAVGSHARQVDLYDINGTKLQWRRALKGFHATITHLDFSMDCAYIQTNTADYELIYFSTDTGALCRSSSLRDVEWATWTCVLGFPVQGIFPPFSDGTDVNACMKNEAGTLIASAEDSGLVKLYQYPCIGDGFNHRGINRHRPDAKEKRGHSSHVTNVCWLFDEEHLASTGGNDRSVFVWKLVQ
eukprot:TRINITY_DN2512_c1_g3_i1.p1 TRINITY_DN2512_c1_g3~~TRINITY_DN2512_c1_g3_i1.p1  ORF type:complete len:761 (-),score=218.41 TRINITY_DN2512_c1_g3_i1:1889-4171(-)